MYYERECWCLFFNVGWSNVRRGVVDCLVGFKIKLKLVVEKIFLISINKNWFFFFRKLVFNNEVNLVEVVV